MFPEVILCLLMVVQNNEFLLKNQQSRSIDSITFPEVNGISFDNHRGNYGCGCGSGREKNNQYRKGNVPVVFLNIW